MLKVGYTPCTEDPPHGANIAQVLEQAMVEAQTAQECGFDSCFFTEHHQQADCYIPNPMLLALAAGQKTQSIKVGTCVTLLPLQHPVHVAEDSAIVDLMTGGRMILGLGVGYSEADFGAFGMSVKERVTRTVEGVEIIKKCWAEGAFSYHGKHYHLEQVSITPKPRQKPRPPIWLGAGTPAGLRRAARLGDAWVADLMQSVGVIKRFAQLYRDEAERYGKTPFVALMRDVWLADSMETARRESQPLMYTHRFYFRNRGYVEDEFLKDVSSEEGWTFDRAAKNRLIVGSPQDCREQLEMWQEEVHPDYLILRMRYPGGPPHNRVVESIRIFGETILPAFS